MEPAGGLPASRLACAHAADGIRHKARLQPFDVRYEGARRDRGAGDVLVRHHLLEAGLVATRVDHVAREEDLHLACHTLGALATGLVTERVRKVIGDLRQAVAPELERLEQVALGLGRLVRHVEVARPVHDRRRLDAEAVHLVLGVHRLVRRARPLEQREQLLALSVRLAHEHGRVVRVVLECPLLARVEAAPHEQHQEDQDDQCCAHGYRPAHHHGLPIGRASARAAAGTSYGLVRFVEEGHGQLRGSKGRSPPGAVGV